MKKDIINMKKRRYWLFVTDEDNWKIIRDKEIYGFNEKSKKDLEKLQLGDSVVIYIKGKKIGGVFEITNLNEITTTKFKGDNYENKIKLKKIFIPNYPSEFKKNMVNNISIFKDKSRWGTILMGRATREINEQDYKYFEEILKC